MISASARIGHKNSGAGLRGGGLEQQRGDNEEGGQELLHKVAIVDSSINTSQGANSEGWDTQLASPLERERTIEPLVPTHEIKPRRFKNKSVASRLVLALTASRVTFFGALSATSFLMSNFEKLSALIVRK